ncbi:MAG: universal stress protein [Bacillota bacterium]
MYKILLAVDGSEHSDKAVERTSRFAKKLDAEITIVNVVPEITASSASAYYATVQTEGLLERREAYMERGQKILKEAKEKLAEEGIEANTKIDVGDPADFICDYAEENDFDLIVVADKGLGAVKRFLLGSISDKVVHHAKTSVLIVK